MITKYWKYKTGRRNIWFWIRWLVLSWVQIRQFFKCTLLSNWGRYKSINSEIKMWWIILFLFWFFNLKILFNGTFAELGRLKIYILAVLISKKGTHSRQLFDLIRFHAIIWIKSQDRKQDCNSSKGVEWGWGLELLIRLLNHWIIDWSSFWCWVFGQLNHFSPTISNCNSRLKYFYSQSIQGWLWVRLGMCSQHFSGYC